MEEALICLNCCAVKEWEGSLRKLPTRWPNGKNLGISAGRLGYRIPGRGKCSLGTIAVEARVNYPLYLF